MFSPSWKRSRLALRACNNFVFAFCFVWTGAEREFYHNHTHRTASSCVSTVRETSKDLRRQREIIKMIFNRSRTDSICVLSRRRRIKCTIVRIGARALALTAAYNVTLIPFDRWFADCAANAKAFILHGEGDKTVRNNRNANEMSATPMCLNWGGRPQSAFAFTVVITNIPLSDNN